MTSTIIVISSYIATQILSDIASLKIVLFAGFSMDAGTLIYPITFTLRDMVHKVVGKKCAKVIIITAAIINLAMAALFWIVSQLPYDASAGIQPDWNSVLAPVWRIVIASIVAEVTAELVDTEVYHFWVNRITTRFQWMRVLISNFVSVPLDSLAFCWLAFGGTMPIDIVLSIFWSNVALKGIVTIIGMPLIYAVKEQNVQSS